ncbi:MAG: tetratricopeptide repeat protein [Leptolyngbyaceae cyanobacterium]
MAHTACSAWRQWLLAIALTVTGWGAMPLIAWAQLSPVLVDQFLSDPELTEPRDPLLPELPVVRPLSPLEKSALEVELDELAEEAETLYQAGRIEAAFELWLREVRLRRILGYEAELEAIQRVGLRAWENSRGEDVQLITLRLRQIQTDLLSEAPLDIERLEEVVAAFEVLRDVDAAVAVYETLIVRAAQRGDRDERQRLLENLASLRESWFRFAVAGETYQTLLNSLDSDENLKEIEYLKGAIRNYQDAGDLSTTITYQRRLVRQYEATLQPRPIPSLTLAIARNLRALDNLDQAQTFYSTTYTTALTQGQTDVASDALQDLTELYLEQEKLADVIYLYQQRIAVERLSYNGYGLMQTFDQLGQFYEAQAQPEAAIAVYKEALIIAEHLNYRDGYFKLRLQNLLYEQGQLDVPALEQHQASPVGPLQDPDAWLGNAQP